MIDETDGPTITLADGEAAIVFRNSGHIGNHYFRGNASDKVSERDPLFMVLLISELFNADNEDARQLLLALRRIVYKKLPKPALVPLADGATGTCGRCYDEVSTLYASNCEDDPQSEENGNQGMYHCTDCGAMVLGGLPHPPLCVQCIERSHPVFDLGEKPPYREAGGPLKVVYAPGSFDWFEGTPEELEELKREIEGQFANGMPKGARKMTAKDMEELAQELKARGKNTRQ